MLFSLLYFFQIFFVEVKVISVFIHCKTVFFRKLNSKFFNFVILISIKFKTLPNKPNICPFLFNFTILNFLFILLMQTFQSLRHFSTRVFKCLHQVLSILTFILRNKCDCSTLVSSSSRSTHSMYIVLQMIRTNIVHN